MGFGWLPSLILRCFCGRRRPRSSQNLQDLEPEAGSVTESESVITELSPEGSPVKTPTETSPTEKSVSRKSPAEHLGPGDRTGAEPGGEAENGESSSAGRESRRGSPRETDRHRHSGQGTGNYQIKENRTLLIVNSIAGDRHCIDCRILIHFSN